MNSKVVKLLRRQQAFGVDHLTQGSALCRVVIIPTGGGKTALVSVAVKNRMDLGTIKGAFLATSRSHIEEAFAEHQHWSHNGQEIEIPPEFWVRPRGNSVASLNSYLSNPAGRCLLTSHSQMAMWHNKGLLPCGDLTGWVLILDEGHHNGEGVTVLAEITADWLRRGAEVWLVTASGIRDADGARCWPVGVTPLAFAYSELAAEGTVVPNICIRLQALMGREPRTPVSETDIVNLAKYIRDPEPKGSTDIAPGERPTLVRISPNLPKGEALLLAKRLSEALQRADVGYKKGQIEITIGDGEQDATEKVLARERAASKGAGFGALQTKVIISCQRLGEGADWPAGSHMVFLGVPTNLLTIQQGIGRITRDKRDILDYPSRMVHTGLVTMIVDSVDEDDDMVDQTQRVLLMALMLECTTENDSILDYHRGWPNLVRGLRFPPMTRPPSKSVLDRLRDAGLDPDATLDITRIPFEVAHLIRYNLGVTPTILAMAKIVVVRAGARASYALLKLLLDTSADYPLLRARQWEVIRKALQDTILESDGKEEAEVRAVYSDHLLVGLLGLAEEFKDLVYTQDLKVSHGFESVIGFEKMREVGVRMQTVRNEVDHVSDMKAINEFILPYKAMYGRYPIVGSGVQDVSRFALQEGWTLERLDRAIRRNGFDLARLITVISTTLRGPLDLPLVRDLYRRGKKIIPTTPEVHWANAGALVLARMSPEFALPQGENLICLDLALRRGWRGLPGNQTLREVVA